jgi:hypothetical protein
MHVNSMPRFAPGREGLALRAVVVQALGDSGRLFPAGLGAAEVLLPARISRCRGGRLRIGTGSLWDTSFAALICV